MRNAITAELYLEAHALRPMLQAASVLVIWRGAHHTLLRSVEVLSSSGALP